MGLSFILAPLAGASTLQAFAAGAALCSTSLGTTFTLLATSGLSATRLGVVLTSAAMMDDVVGLIMVQVISNLGSSSSSFDAVTVIRPVFVSLAFAILLPLACRFIVLPATRFVAAKREICPKSAFSKLMERELTALVVHTCTLVATVAGATYAGSSALLGAYIAGAMVSWWDVEGSHPRGQTGSLEPQQEAESPVMEMTNAPSNATPESAPAEAGNEMAHSSNSGAEIFEKYYAPSLQRILKPFFFVSRQSWAERSPLTSVGLRWILDPHHQDVHRFRCLAGPCLHSLDDHWQAALWYLAPARTEPVHEATDSRPACR